MSFVKPYYNNHLTSIIVNSNDWDGSAFVQTFTPPDDGLYQVTLEYFNKVDSNVVRFIDSALPALSSVAIVNRTASTNGSETITIPLFAALTYNCFIGGGAITSGSTDSAKITFIKIQ